MARATAVTNEEWAYASKLKTTSEVFLYMTRNFTAKNPLPAEKIHGVEFIVKP